MGIGELAPWTVNRLTNSPWAYISTATARYNLQTGFTWDNDPFATNQASHPYHGGAYFNAARTNGFSFWESAPFVLAGSFLWEMFMENQPPSMNDLLNTTMGGIVFGEVQFRAANMIFDNTATGLQRILREAGGFVVNPVGGFNRLVHGEMWATFQNPPDRLPSSLYIELDGLYRHGSGPVPSRAGEDQGGLSVLMRYGDPFEGVHRDPFEYFDVSLSLLTPHSAFITEIVARGLLVDGTLSASPSAEQRFGLFLEMDYFNHEQAVYGAQVVGASHLMRVPLGAETELRTEVGLMGIPIIGVGVDYPEENIASTSGVTYDYGAGFGAQVSARLRRREVDLLVLAWSLVGQRASNGISKSSRIQALSAEARLPLTRNLVVGGGWSWGERTTTYDRLPTVDSSGTAWRVFAGWGDPHEAGYAGPDGRIVLLLRDARFPGTVVGHRLRRTIRRHPGPDGARAERSDAERPDVRPPPRIRRHARPDSRGRMVAGGDDASAGNPRDRRSVRPDDAGDREHVRARRPVRLRRRDRARVLRRRSRRPGHPRPGSVPPRRGGDGALRSQHRPRRALLPDSRDRNPRGRALPVPRERRTPRRHRL